MIGIYLHRLKVKNHQPDIWLILNMQHKKHIKLAIKV